MKVAVCLGGLIRGKVEENIEVMKQVFPYDFFLSTWDTVERFSPFENIKTYKEPELLEESQVYHPNKNRIEILRRGHKQLIAHAYMLDDLSTEYDMIVRARYDIRVNTNIKWKELIETSYKENAPIGFGSLDLNHFRKMKKIIYGSKGERTEKLGGGLNDTLILHPRKLFNSSRVFELYKSKQLNISELGWWQILVKENFGDVSHENDPCHNYIGGVVIDRHLVE